MKYLFKLKLFFLLLFVSISSLLTAQVIHVELSVDLQELEICQGSTEVEQVSKNLQLYPNPSTGMVLLEGEGYPNECNIKLYDAYGRMLFSELVQSRNNKLMKEIDLSMYPKGIYILVIPTYDNVISNTIILK